MLKASVTSTPAFSARASPRAPRRAGRACGSRGCCARGRAAGARRSAPSPRTAPRRSRPHATSPRGSRAALRGISVCGTSFVNRKS
ncbi:MAG: hypothetical protein DMF67_08610 [Acidobacteria bacterium]|nr:MAG: hypothetical protein DMF67_08610 [Acidobacteriota bacterium]